MSTSPANPAKSSPPRTFAVALALLLVALIPALASAWLHPKAPAWQNAAPASDTITWADARSLTGALWIDARPSGDFARSHVPGALSLPASDWDAHLEAVLREWRPGRPVIVYCGGDGCLASHAAARRLRDELGLTGIHVLAGGWQAPSSPAP